jgi:hypothetical protein
MAAVDTAPVPAMQTYTEKIVIVLSIFSSWKRSGRIEVFPVVLPARFGKQVE